jgi:MarR family transcriptional regulator, organic hydroperoxide resistance regulator
MEHPEQPLGALLVQVCRSHRNLASAMLGELGLHAGQEAILFHLFDQDGCTQSELADCMCLEPPTITRMMQRMERVGLIERRPDAEDARVSRVYLTAQGRALQNPVEAVWEQLEARTFDGLSDVEQALLRRLLTQIHQSLNATT